MGKIKKVLILFLLIVNQACVRGENSKKIEKTDNKTFYFVDYSYNKKCGFAIYINDILVAKQTEPINIDYAVAPINPYILKSGIQKIKIELFPFVVDQKLESDIEFNLKVFFVKDYNEEIVDSSENLVFDLPPLMIDAQLSEWRFENSFIAEVPYQVTGWSNSQNLKELKNIETQLRKKFKDLVSFIENKDPDKILKEFAISMKESESFYYLTKNQLDNSRQDFITLIRMPNIFIAPLDNTVVKYYANGKLVTLETLDGKPALRIIQEGEDYSNEDNFPILFHMPIGSEELEIIR